MIVHVLLQPGQIRISEAQAFVFFLSAPDDFGVQWSLRNIYITYLVEHIIQNLTID